MADISIPHIWCVVHGSRPITEALNCRWCAEAVVLKHRSLRATEFSGRCEFCGGAVPCMKEE